jgi:2-polyprenyl-3-methyl-5-hydroxy-6-metoxy-1,4-benzoquinol methylase
MAMHHVQDFDNMIAQFAAHLKPQGRVALSDLDAEDGSFHTSGTEGVFHQGFDRAEFQAVLQKHGLTQVQFVTAYVVKGETQSYPIFLAMAVKA